MAPLPLVTTRRCGPRTTAARRGRRRTGWTRTRRCPGAGLACLCRRLWRPRWLGSSALRTARMGTAWWFGAGLLLCRRVGLGEGVSGWVGGRWGRGGLGRMRGEGRMGWFLTEIHPRHASESPILTVRSAHQFSRRASSSLCDTDTGLFHRPVSTSNQICDAVGTHQATPAQHHQPRRQTGPSPSASRPRRGPRHQLLSRPLLLFSSLAFQPHLSLRPGSS